MYLILGVGVGACRGQKAPRTCVHICSHHHQQHVATSNTKSFGLLQDDDKKKLHTRFFIGLKKDSSIILYVAVYGSFFCTFCNKKKVLQKVLKKLFKELQPLSRVTTSEQVFCFFWHEKYDFNRPIQMIFHGKIWHKFVKFWRKIIPNCQIFMTSFTIRLPRI